METSQSLVKFSRDGKRKVSKELLFCGYGFLLWDDEKFWNRRGCLKTL